MFRRQVLLAAAFFAICTAANADWMCYSILPNEDCGWYAQFYENGCTESCDPRTSECIGHDYEVFDLYANYRLWLAMPEMGESDDPTDHLYGNYSSSSVYCADTYRCDPMCEFHNGDFRCTTYGFVSFTIMSDTGFDECVDAVQN